VFWYIYHGIELLKTSFLYPLVLTSSQRVRGVLVVGQIVEDGRLATRPGTHEQNQWLGEDLGIAEVAVAQVAVLVEGLQGLDSVLVDALNVPQDDLGHIIGGLLAGIELLIQLQQFRNVLATATVLGNDSFLKMI